MKEKLSLLEPVPKKAVTWTAKALLACTKLGNRMRVKRKELDQIHLKSKIARWILGNLAGTSMK